MLASSSNSRGVPKQIIQLKRNESNNTNIRKNMSGCLRLNTITQNNSILGKESASIGRCNTNQYIQETLTTQLAKSLSLKNVIFKQPSRNTCIGGKTAKIQSNLKNLHNEIIGKTNTLDYYDQQISLLTKENNDYYNRPPLSSRIIQETNRLNSNSSKKYQTITHESYRPPIPSCRKKTNNTFLKPEIRKKQTDFKRILLESGRIYMNYF